MIASVEQPTTGGVCGATYKRTAASLDGAGLIEGGEESREMPRSVPRPGHRSRHQALGAVKLGRFKLVLDDDQTRCGDSLSRSL